MNEHFIGSGSEDDGLFSHYVQRVQRFHKVCIIIANRDEFQMRES